MFMTRRVTSSENIPWETQNPSSCCNLLLITPLLVASSHRNVRTIHDRHYAQQRCSSLSQCWQCRCAIKGGVLAAGNIGYEIMPQALGPVDAWIESCTVLELQSMCPFWFSRQYSLLVSRCRPLNRREVLPLDRLLQSAPSRPQDLQL